MFAGVAGLTVPDSRARRDALAAMASVLPDAKDPMVLYEDLRRRRKHLAPVERLALLRMEQALKTSGDELAETTRELLERAGMPELQCAMDAGVLGIHMLNLETAAPDEFSQTVIEGLTRVLTEAVSSKARTYPLFDDGTGELVGKIIAEGRITDVRTARGAEVGAAGRLIGRMEAFPDAEMDVVLDVREQLAKPLVRSADHEPDQPQWTWSFGDGVTTTTTTASVNHTYTTAGAKTATLTVTDSVGLTGTISKKITVT
jgi:hypothetical protein